jgi:hypothetical protein
MARASLSIRAKSAMIEGLISKTLYDYIEHTLSVARGKTKKNKRYQAKLFRLLVAKIREAALITNMTPIN